MKVSVRLLNMLFKLTNQRSCPDSVHVLYISMEFRAANCTCESQTGFQLRYRLPRTKIKGMNMLRLLLLVLTLTPVFVSRAFGAGDDEDLKSEIENKHEVSCL